MHELITRALYYFHVHLLYASIVWLVAWVLTSIPRGSATAKYWIWVATSLNFIFPAGAVVDTLGASHLSWAAPLGVVGDAANRLSRSPAAPVIGAVWLLGAIVMLGRVLSRVRAERRDAEATTRPGGVDSRPAFLAHGFPVRFAAARQGPAVDGILRTRISLPDGIDRLLSEPELDAVLVHEVTHARRRDNLIRLIHEVGLCLMWFHPLVWITGSRIALYRELSCDESVIQRGRGGNLVSALAKLASREAPYLLQASVASFLTHRLARLAAAQPRRSRLAANMLLTLIFLTVLLAGILGTVSHTACCFVARP